MEPKTDTLAALIVRSFAFILFVYSLCILLGSVVTLLEAKHFAPQDNTYGDTFFMLTGGGVLLPVIECGLSVVLFVFSKPIGRVLAKGL